MISHCGFDLHFPVTTDVEHFSCAYLPFFISSLERYLCRSFAHFKIGIFVLLLLSCKSSEYLILIYCVYIFWMPDPYQYDL